MSEVSIIVPNYNHARYIAQRLDSIFNQTYQDFEVILLDDCSSDNSLEIINEYKDNPKITHLVVNNKNGGNTFNQWVKGIELATGHYIWIAESDDFTDTRFLETAINALKYENCPLFFCQSFVVDEHGTINGHWNYGKPIYDADYIVDGKELIQKYMINENIIPNASAVVFKKKVLDASIYRNVVNYQINGDWYLWINLLMKGNCAFNSEPLNYFRRHKGASSSRNVVNYKNIEEAFRLNVFLKEQDFKINGRRWLRTWIIQADYKIKTLFKTNFINIYKLSFSLFPFPFTYLLFLFLYNKVSKLNRYIKLK
jgi:glycosyltransferase involved in cell wall biosynthesis